MEGWGLVGSGGGGGGANIQPTATISMENNIHSPLTGTVFESFPFFCSVHPRAGGGGCMVEGGGCMVEGGCIRKGAGNNVLKEAMEIQTKTTTTEWSRLSSGGFVYIYKYLVKIIKKYIYLFLYFYILFMPAAKRVSTAVIYLWATALFGFIFILTVSF